MSTRTEILFPVGRLVMGSLYEQQTKDQAGNLRTVKSGPRVGQPNPVYYFAVAIPKTPGHTHWAQTDWGSKIWQVGHAAFPTLVHPTAGLPKKFAWKITDGDSNEPNEAGRLPSSKEGFPGHWVVGFSSTYAPKLFTLPGPTPLTEPNAIKRGYYVEVYGTVAGNDQPTKAGVYINHSMVALRGYGAEITSGPDAAAVGFGANALPAGASAVPTGQGLTPPAPTVPGVPPPVAVVPAAVIPPPVAASPPVAVVPHPGFMVPAPAAAAPPPPPAALPVWKGPVGTSQAQYAAAGWSVDQMRAQGLIA